MTSTDPSIDDFCRSLQAMLSQADGKREISSAATKTGFNQGLVETIYSRSIEPTVLQTYVTYACEVTYLTRSKSKGILPSFEAILAKTCHNPPATLVEKIELETRVQIYETRIQGMIDACQA